MCSTTSGLISTFCIRYWLRALAGAVGIKFQCLLPAQPAQSAREGHSSLCAAAVAGVTGCLPGM